MGRKVCTSYELLWTAKVAAQYARVSETMVKKAMVEGVLTTCDPFGNDRDIRTTVKRYTKAGLRCTPFQPYTNDK